MGLYSRGLIFEWFFCQQIIGLIFEGAYNRGGLYSRFYGIHLNSRGLFEYLKAYVRVNLIQINSIWEFRDIRICQYCAIPPQGSCGGLAEVLRRSCGGPCGGLAELSTGLAEVSCGAPQGSSGGLAEVLRRSCGGPCGGLRKTLNFYITLS